jgi:hypothetical protein
MLLIGIVAGTVGAGVGAGSLLWYLSGPMQRGVLARMQLDATYSILVLKELRAGKLDDAQALLEDRVDATVAGLHAFVLDDSKLSPEAISTLKTIADYRAGVSYIPSETAKRAGVPEILDAARKGHLTPQSRTDAR